jgi:hypothetical protein
VDPRSKSAPRFALTSADFPPFLEAGRDSLNTELALVAGSGSAPFSYTAAAASGITPPEIVAQKWVRWRPQLADTGSRRLYLTARDAEGDQDTLLLQMLVVPPNRPCSLWLDLTDHDTLADGSLDYSTNKAPDTLRFTVSDPDAPLVERHRIEVRLSQTTVVSGLDASGRFTLALDPAAAHRRVDTLQVRVTDRAGHSSTVSRLVYYARPSFSRLARVVLNTSATGANVGETVYDFPTLVRFKPADRIVSLYSRREQIQFAKPDGTVLPYAFEAWDSLADSALVWVRMDTLWGNNDSQYVVLTNDDSTWISDTSSSAAVFSAGNGFAGVWHLDEKGTGKADEYRDATANANHGQGGAASANGVPQQYPAGIIGQAQFFDGVDDHIDCGDGASLDITGESLTLTAWIGFQDTTRPQGIVTKAGWYDGYRVLVDPNSNPGMEVNFELTGVDNHRVVTDGKLDLYMWYHMACTYDGAKMRVYINGVADPMVYDRTGPVAHSVERLWLGHGAPVVGQWFSYPFFGVMDEVQICSVGRSAGWIKLCYQNQRPSTTLTRIVRETAPAPVGAPLRPSASIAPFPVYSLPSTP